MMGKVQDYTEARQAARRAAGVLGMAALHSIVSASQTDAGVRAANMRADRVTIERAMTAFYAALDAQVGALESAIGKGE